MRPEEGVYSEVHGSTKLSWDVRRLWQLAADLPRQSVEISQCSVLDEDCWFGDVHVPTVRAVADHTRRIQEADLSFPIILSAEGNIMDGVHRVAKALLLNISRVNAVQFEQTPPADRVETVS